MPEEILSADPARAVIAPEVATLPDTAPDEPIEVGQTWRGRYFVETWLPSAVGRQFRARNLTDQTSVRLFTLPLTDPAARAETFARLQTLNCPQLSRPLEAHATAEGRVEIWSDPAGVSLREWRKTNPAPVAPQIAQLVASISTAIEALAEQGLGHFGLDSDAVMVAASDSNLEFVVGDLSQAGPLETSGPVSLHLDPFTIPPEATEASRHPTGASLRAWDWWSLGRVVQEFILGASVVESLPEDVIAWMPPEPPAQAEALLLERSNPVVRAGGVAFMPDLDPRVGQLLRGLLSSAPAGRWSAIDVREWLAGELPSVRYDYDRPTQFFFINGRPFSIADAADCLRDADHWQDAAGQILHATEPGTFAHFLAESPLHSADEQKVKTVLELAETKALAVLPEPLRHSILANLALHVLAERPFRWHGHALDAETIRRELSAPDTAAAVVTELVALADPMVNAQIRRHDPSAAQFLEKLVKTVSEAQTIATARLGLPTDPADPANRLWLLALEGEAAWTARLQSLRARFSHTTLPKLEKLYATAHHLLPPLLVLASLADHPERYGFVSHEESQRHRLEHLRARRAQITPLLFWRTLAVALRSNPFVFGSIWQLAIGAVVAFVPIATLFPGPVGLVAGLIPGAFFTALRLGANRLQAAAANRHSPGRAPWRWFDSAPRADGEAVAIGLAHSEPSHLPEVRAEIARLDAEIAPLSAKAAAPSPAPQIRHVATWTAAFASWALAGVICLGSIGLALKRPVSSTDHVMAWKKALGVTRPAPVPKKPAEKISWPFKKSEFTPPFDVTTDGEFTPGAEQAATALIRARELIDDYFPASINTEIAIFVPLEDALGGVLFYDPRTDKLTSPKGFIIALPLFPRSWINLGGKTVFFLDR